MDITNITKVWRLIVLHTVQSSVYELSAEIASALDVHCKISALQQSSEKGLMNVRIPLEEYSVIF